MKKIIFFSALSAQFRADTPAPPFGLSALTPPPRQAPCSSWPSRSGPAGRPASASLRGRTGGRDPGTRPAPRRYAPGSTIRVGGTAPGCARVGPALGSGGRAPAGTGTPTRLMAQSGPGRALRSSSTAAGRDRAGPVLRAGGRASAGTGLHVT
jgi:hypothetical protein